MQEAKRLEAEKLAREKPEYDRWLQMIRENPESVVTNSAFYSWDHVDTPASRAFRAALGDKSIQFNDKTLAELLDKLPPDNHWNREQIFARPELSSATIEQFYPKALDWGEHLNYTILANIATNPNTPRHIVEDLAGRKDLPVGATQPAQRQLKKYLAEEKNHSTTNSIPK